MSWICSVEWVRWPATDKGNSDLRDGEKLHGINGVWIFNPCTKCGDMAEWVWECDVCGGWEYETGYLCLDCLRKIVGPADPKECEANARLIAKAPEMAELWKRLFVLVDDYEEFKKNPMREKLPPTTEEYRAIENEARQLLAEIEGGVKP